MTEEEIDLTDHEWWYNLGPVERVEVVKNTVTLPEVAQLLGIDAEEGDKIPSPWNPDERTPSCHVYEDHFFDYSTGRGGDVFDLMRIMNPEAYGEAEIGVLADDLKNRAVKAGLEYGRVEEQEPRGLQNFIGDMERYTPYEDQSLYLRVEFGVRADGDDLLVPHREGQGTHECQVYGVKTRYANGGKGSWAGSQFTHRLYDPYGWSPGYVPANEVIICEGESDAWAMLHAVHQTMDVLALPSGSGSWKDHWRQDLKCYDTVHICMDNDAAGQRARDKLMSKVGWAVAKELRVPQLYGDAREAITAGWRPFE